MTIIFPRYTNVHFKKRFLIFIFVWLLEYLPVSIFATPLEPVLIGNFLRDAPCGIAWVVNDSAAFVLNTGGPYVTGTAAPDDSYHNRTFDRLVFQAKLHKLPSSGSSGLFRFIDS
jgi:hypothetical protein